MPAQLELSLCVEIACLWEATARKAGNVHPHAEFANLRYLDFLHSAAAIAPVFARAESVSVGTTVLHGVEATRRVVTSNTNLGILLLLAPLARVPRHLSVEGEIEAVLASLTVEDSRLVYQAIAKANPGGMGQVAEQDVQAAPTFPLREIMCLAKDRDLVARQYANGFADVFAMVPRFLADLEILQKVETAIQATHLRWMAAFPDSLICRKTEASIAAESQQRAQAILDEAWPTNPKSQPMFHEFDDWLRAEGNRRNPGTSADLTTACIFLALRDHKIQIPLTLAWS